MKLNIEDLIQTNNDHTHITQILTNSMSKYDAISALMEYKLQTSLTTNKAILVDQTLNALQRLIET